MTDRELLELAAKAAGIPDGYWNCEHHDHGHGEYWNPLEEDGDALRLAVKLHMNVETTGLYAHACGFYKSSFECFCIQEPTGSDPYAALRRAIVRAAAEIGKGMK
jgi:hypothetical protein